MTEKEKQERKADRTPARIRAEVVAKKIVDTTTINVSRNGIFLKDITDRNINSLLRVRLYLPPKQKPIEVFGKVAWKGNNANVAGVGVHFLNLESNDRRKWLEFITEIESLTGPNIASPQVSDRMSPTDLEKPTENRTPEKTTASFMVRFRSRDRLKDFVAGDVSKGEMFLKTPVLRAVGERVQVVIIHPKTDKDFELEAEVARLNEEGTADSPKGMGLKFVNLTDELRAALEIFVNDA